MVPVEPRGLRPRAVTAAPAPRFAEGHRFAPIDPNWRVETYLLKKWGNDDPPNSSLAVPLKDRDPNYKEYVTAKRYYAKGEDEKPRKLLWYYPSGRLSGESDIIGKNQYDRSWHPDGRKAGYLHWRDGKWLNGESISPDGKVRHRLKQGDGELVTYGSKPGNRLHRWYAGAANILDKRFRDGRVIEIRLNGSGSDWLILTEEEESLKEEKGIWRKSGGQPASWQSWEDGGKMGRRQPPTRTYEKARGSFVKDYDAILKDAGLSWEKLGIDFIRDGKPWPKAAR